MTKCKCKCKCCVRTESMTMHWGCGEGPRLGRGASWFWSAETPKRESPPRRTAGGPPEMLIGAVCAIQLFRKIAQLSHTDHRECVCVCVCVSIALSPSLTLWVC